MNAKRILCPTDFSSFSQEAIAYASSLASKSGGTLFIVHVEERPLPYGAGHAGYVPDVHEHEDLSAALEKVVPNEAGIAYEHHLLSGTVDEEIVNFAKNNDIDLIVIGTHGRTGLAHALMGSTAEKVVRRAECPVLAVKQPHAQATSAR